MMRCFALSCLFILLTGTLYAQNPSRVVDSLFYGKKGFKNNATVIGANVGVLYNDSAYFYSYGYTSREKNKKTDTATIFEIGGVTKAFTGLLMADAITKKLLDKSIVVERFIPVNTALVNKLKVIDLGTGISGLPTLNKAGDITGVSDVEQPFNTVDQAYMTNIATGTTALNNPGEYTNSNYAFGLLGLIVSAANQTDYNTLLQQTILGPLHLDHTTTQTPVSDKNMAKGYSGDKEMPYIKLSGLAPAGILKSTVTDMLQFISYEMTYSDTLSLADGIKYSQYVQYASADIQSSLGWEIVNMDGTDVYFMHGKTYGFSAAIAFDKTTHLGIVVMLNNNDEDVATEALKYIHEHILAKPEKPVPARKPAAKKKPVVKK